MTSYEMLIFAMSLLAILLGSIGVLFLWRDIARQRRLRRQREDACQPDIEAHCAKVDGTVFLVLRNIGGGVAYDIDVDLAPRRQGAERLPPGKRIKLRPEAALPPEVTIRWRSREGRHHQRQFRLAA